MKPLVTLSRALIDPQLFGGTFAAPSFWTWRTLAKLIDGIPLTEPRELELYKTCTGRSDLPGANAPKSGADAPPDLAGSNVSKSETNVSPTGRSDLAGPNGPKSGPNVTPKRRIILLAGRRAGKDRFLSAVAVWRAALCCDWRKHISTGEQAVCLLLGADKKQAAILRRYCEGLLRAPLLAPEVTRQTNEVIEFKNGASLEIATNDARLVRGRSAIAVLGSECCHWRTDEFSASSDEEVVGAAEPSMAMCPDGGLMLLGSSVHRRVGYMYRQYKKLFGNDAADAVCWFAPSATMNPSLPAHVVDKALAENAPKARAEFLNVFREDLADFIPPDVVDAATDFDVHERAPIPGADYVAYCDASSGVADSFALAIAHRGSPTILDVVRERKPRFVPAQVIAEFAELLKLYGITTIQGDRYAIGFHEAEWRVHGINFVACERTTSENYLHSLPLLLAGRARLVDSMTLRSQLSSLERRVGAGDKETVSHPQHASAHDDVAAAACGALALAASTGRYRYPSGPTSMDWVRGADIPNPADQAEQYTRERLGTHILTTGGFFGRRGWR